MIALHICYTHENEALKEKYDHLHIVTFVKSRCIWLLLKFQVIIQALDCFQISVNLIYTET